MKKKYAQTFKSIFSQLRSSLTFLYSRFKKKKKIKKYIPHHVKNFEMLKAN